LGSVAEFRRGGRRNRFFDLVVACFHQVIRLPASDARSTQTSWKLFPRRRHPKTSHPPRSAEVPNAS
jgi:hypothetical protein